MTLWKLSGARLTRNHPSMVRRNRTQPTSHTVCVERPLDLEHLTFNQVVAGSIPARPTNKSIT